MYTNKTQMIKSSPRHNIEEIPVMSVYSIKPRRSLDQISSFYSSLNYQSYEIGHKKSKDFSNSMYPTRHKLLELSTEA